MVTLTVACVFGSFLIPQRSNALVVGSHNSNGFTMHFNVDLWGTTHIGWTIQPGTVEAIDNWIHNFPYAGGATIAAMATEGALVCGALLSGLGAAVCATYFAIYQGYLIDQIHHAHQQRVCVTVKLHIPLFKVFDPLHILWDVFPYVDSGSWCNKKVYITPPPPPNPQGPRTPGGCSMDPTNVDCGV